MYLTVTLDLMYLHLGSFIAMINWVITIPFFIFNLMAMHVSYSLRWRVHRRHRTHPLPVQPSAIPRQPRMHLYHQPASGQSNSSQFHVLWHWGWRIFWMRVWLCGGEALAFFGNVLNLQSRKQLLGEKMKIKKPTKTKKMMGLVFMVMYEGRELNNWTEMVDRSVVCWDWQVIVVVMVLHVRPKLVLF